MCLLLLYCTFIYADLFNTKLVLKLNTLLKQLFVVDTSYWHIEYMEYMRMKQFVLILLIVLTFNAKYTMSLQKLCIFC